MGQIKMTTMISKLHRVMWIKVINYHCGKILGTIFTGNHTKPTIAVGTTVLKNNAASGANITFLVF